MKLFGKTNDAAIGTLLRAYVSRPADHTRTCPEFDPDFLNSYVERSLTLALRSRYEAHLSECGACRKSVVALTRLAQAQGLASSTPARGESGANWLAGARRWFGAMSAPQWAMAATAVTVLAISIPLLLSQNGTRSVERASTATGVEPPSEKGQGAGEVAQASPATNPNSADSSKPALTTAKERETGESQPLTKSVAVPGPEPGVPGGAAAAEESKKGEAKNSAQPTDAVSKSEGQVASPAPARVAEASQVAKSDSDQGRQQQEKDSPQAGEPKAVRADEQPTGKEKGRAEEVAAPPKPAPATEVARARGGETRSRARLSLRDSGAPESVRPAERKIAGKKFSFKEGAWTDKDFDPSKSLPVVTIIRDSNVYKEVLTKRAGLKPYLTEFAEADRAIIVYKGTVYKLIPQQGEK